MSRFSKASALAISIIILTAIVVTGCSSRFVSPGKETGSLTPAPVSPSASPTNGLSQSNGEGAVTIALAWQGQKSNSLIFSVAMDTHSVDLDQYDLGKLTILRDDAASEYRPISWQAAPGGHHRSGTLTFPLPDSLSQGKAKYLEIVIRDVADIKERVLRWEL